MIRVTLAGIYAPVWRIAAEFLPLSFFFSKPALSKETNFNVVNYVALSTSHFKTYFSALKYAQHSGECLSLIIIWWYKTHRGRERGNLNDTCKTAVLYWPATLPTCTLNAREEQSLRTRTFRKTAPEISSIHKKIQFRAYLQTSGKYTKINGGNARASSTADKRQSREQCKASTNSQKPRSYALNKKEKGILGRCSLRPLQASERGSV